METIEKCRVVLLDSTNYTDIVHSTSKYGGLFHSRHYSPMKNMGDTYKHIYIIEDTANNKADDWCINKNRDTLYQVSIDKAENWFTVIASTDPQCNLPSPSTAFIDKYIQSYNDGEIIEEIMVEYIQLMVKGNYNNKCSICGELFSYSDKLNFICSKCGLRPKVASHNTITIKSVKTQWSKEELLAITRKAFDDSCKYTSFKDFVKEEID